MSDQLFISEYDNVYLPPEYHFSHNLAVRLYDDLVWILKDEKTQKKGRVNIKFKDNEIRPTENEEDILSWLLKNGYEKQANEVILRNTLFAIISDICHFTFQALDSAKNIKMTVAFSLIRKPFLENLLIIEQLLADEQTFLKNFAGKPEDFDPGRIKEDKKKSLITECISKIKNNWILETDVVYDLRYSKQTSGSFYAKSNLATHLVTTRHSEFKTERNNLNYIFSGYDEWESQLDYLYYFLPYILFYTTEIVDQLLLERKLINIKTFKRRKFLRLFGQLLHFDQHDKKSTKGISTINKISKVLVVKCKSCNKKNQLYKSDMYSLVHKNYILCKHCLVDLYIENNSLEELFDKIIK